MILDASGGGIVACRMSWTIRLADTIADTDENGVGKWGHSKPEVERIEETVTT